MSARANIMYHVVDGVRIECAWPELCFVRTLAAAYRETTAHPESRPLRRRFCELIAAGYRELGGNAAKADEWERKAEEAK